MKRHRQISNMAASVRARLLNRARREGRPFDELLQYYAMERFLYRLSRSQHAQQFVLKGALMLQLWGGLFSRPTKDIDLLGLRTASVEEVIATVQSCMRVDVPDDGLRFDKESLSGEEIRIAARYNGARVRFLAFLENARITLQVDVGFGDVVIPGAAEIVYPSLLEFEPPHLLGTTPETAVAEKVEAMVSLDMANTRMKDFFDVWLIAERRQFSGEMLAQAIGATFKRRVTPLPVSTPIALTPTFYSHGAKQTQWFSYLRKMRIQEPTPSLEQAIHQISALITPVFISLRRKTIFTDIWRPGGPWVSRPC
jgi:hypothetical protein